MVFYLILLKISSFSIFSQKPRETENQKVAYLPPREILHEMTGFSGAHILCLGPRVDSYLCPANRTRLNPSLSQVHVPQVFIYNSVDSTNGGQGIL